MRHFLVTVIGTIVGILLFLFLAFGFLFIYFAMSGKEEAPDHVVLALDLRGAIADHDAGSSLFGSTPTNVVGIVQGLNNAKSDDSVDGLFIRAGQGGMAPASAEEIRLAILDFKSSGKFVITHSQGFESTSFMGYHAVSASDEIWMQDVTSFASSGIRSEVPFYGGVAEKFDAQVQIEQFYEYKNAADVYTQTGFTDAHREATTSLLESLYDTGLEQISTDRNMSKEQLKELFASAPYNAKTAKDLGLIDNVGHQSDAIAYAKSKSGGEDTVIKSVMDYRNAKFVKGPTIAVIGGQGPVVMGGSSSGAGILNNEVTMGGDTLSYAFESAIKDDKVKAIVFRVSTPGGSATASDQIHNAVIRAQKADKPVIISMGQYAASGGYYVSTHADKIVAMPSTITGSIGVVGGKIALRDTYARVGYNVEAIDIGGEFVGAYSGDEPFTQAQQAAYRSQMEDIYMDFTGKVADGRDIPLDRVLDIAKGRVWTGAQAKELGLVDELGGFRKAIALAKMEADIDAETDINLAWYPRPKSQQEQIAEILDQLTQTQEDLASMRKVLSLPEVQAIIKARQDLTSGQELKALLPEIQ